jgi:hypothetical protein
MRKVAADVGLYQTSSVAYCPTLQAETDRNFEARTMNIQGKILVILLK